MSNKSKKKPRPLFNLFKKRKAEQTTLSPTPQSAESSSLQNTPSDPYTPPPRISTPTTQGIQSFPSDPEPSFPQSPDCRQRTQSTAAITQQQTLLPVAQRSNSMTVRERTRCMLYQKEQSLLSMPSSSPGRSTGHVPPSASQIPDQQTAIPIHSPHDTFPTAAPESAPESALITTDAGLIPPYTSAQNLNDYSKRQCLTSSHSLDMPQFPHAPKKDDNADDDSDNIPLANIHNNKWILPDDDDEDDADLVPIATLRSNSRRVGYLSAAEKFKEKAREHLGLDSDDNVPIAIIHRQSLMQNKTQRRQGIGTHFLPQAV